MNSPPDPGSPTSSTPSSGSPPPEEVNYQPSSGTNTYLSNLTSHISNTFGGSSSASKRRLPAGSSFGAAASSRDAKTRRRGDTGGRQVPLTWESANKESGGKKEKDELIDNALVDYLRKGMSYGLYIGIRGDSPETSRRLEIGDPFQELGVKG